MDNKFLPTRVVFDTAAQPPTANDTGVVTANQLKEATDKLAAITAPPKEKEDISALKFGILLVLLAGIPALLYFLSRVS